MILCDFLVKFTHNRNCQKVNMHRSLLLIIAILAISNVRAQNLPYCRTTSPYTYFYSISDRQAQRIARKGSPDPDENLFYSKVDSISYGYDL